MSKYHQRYVAFKLAYIGWHYDGLAVQNTNAADNSIESHLFAALRRVRLVTDRASANYNRSGRTDKGVSALGNVVSLLVRSNLKPAAPTDENGEKAVIYANTPLDTSGPRKEELLYMKMINSVLPPDIQIIAWATVQKDFSARFSTKHRTYKYFFFAENLDIQRMREAAKKLEGEHDFRNFCKLDVVNVRNFVRTIHSFEITPTETSEGLGGILVMTICGQAFLWHQVRMMASVLFLIGSGEEEPSVVDQLLDLSQIEGRPHYEMASEVPLVLWEAAYHNIEWTYDAAALGLVHKAFSGRFKLLAMQATVANAFKTSIEDLPINVEGEQIKWRDTSRPLKRPKYTKLLERGRGDTYESRVARLKGRKKARFSKTSSGQNDEMDTKKDEGENQAEEGSPTTE